MLKTVNIFVETVMLLFFRIHRWIESSKEQHLFDIEIYCSIINVFTLTSDQFNASLLSKSMNVCLSASEGVCVESAGLRGLSGSVSAHAAGDDAD